MIARHIFIPTSYLKKISTSFSIYPSIPSKLS